MKYELGEIIAERRLSSKAEDGLTGEVLVLLGKPRPFPDAPYGDYYCPYQISGVGSEKVSGAGGVDAFQAMQLAMVAIGSTLEYLQKTYKVDLTWNDGSTDLGFPTRV